MTLHQGTFNILLYNPMSEYKLRIIKQNVVWTFCQCLTSAMLIMVYLSSNPTLSKDPKGRDVFNI